MARLNLGCGTDIRQDWINVDKHTSDGVNFAIDLESDSLLNHFKEGSMDYIYCSHVLEHIHNPERVFIDCLTLLRDKGVLELKLPHCSRVKSYTIFHKRQFCSDAFNEFFEGYSSASGQLEKALHIMLLDKRLYWLHKPTNKFLSSINNIVNKIINSNSILQNIMENYLCTFIGGLSEFSLRFEVVKNQKDR